jgi:hypothetical protein
VTGRRITILGLLCASLLARDPGPAIGSVFPDRAIKNLLGPKGAVILNYRVDPKPQLTDRDAFQRLGFSLDAVMSKLALGWYVLDARGLIVSKYLAGDAGELLTPAAILVHQFGWTPPEPAAPEVDGKQLTAKVAASDTTVAPGQRIALILDLDLQPGMHVYAPGVAGYIPIEWKMEDSAAVTVLPTTFPRSEKLFLKAINETVPAYRGHIRLVRDITIAHPGQQPLDTSGKITVPGSLRFQACDDRVCYIPKELHLTWTFQSSRLQ